MSEGRALGVRIVAEGLLIVLSVLAALWVDGWREQRARDVLRDEALTRIRAEIAANLDALEGVGPYHDSILAAGSRALVDPEEWRGRSVVEVGPGLAPRGLVPPALQTTAWDAANAADAVVLFDFETASTIAAAYGWQREGVTMTVRQLSDQIFTVASFDSARTELQLPLILALIQEMRAQERSLAGRYEAALSVLDSVLGEGGGAARGDG